MPAAIPPKPTHTSYQPDPGAVRWYAETIIQMILDYSNQVVKFLSLANAGGAVAVMTFMGADANVRGWPRMWDALELLIIGFVLAVLVAAVNFFTALFLGQRFVSRMKLFAEGYISFDGVFERSLLFRLSILVPIVLALASLGCFSRAAWIGIHNPW
jgi:hypothetical protein